jgi:hypothetical protein
MDSEDEEETNEEKVDDENDVKKGLLGLKPDIIFSN